MAFTVFVDGQEGTTGLRIHEYLAQRRDVEVLRMNGNTLSSTTSAVTLGVGPIFHAADIASSGQSTGGKRPGRHQDAGGVQCRGPTAH